MLKIGKIAHSACIYTEHRLIIKRGTLCITDYRTVPADCDYNIGNAVKMLNEQRDCIVTKASGLYTTAPYGYTDQPEFLNGALCVKTLQSPEQFLRTLHSIEQQLGRERTIHWGPRTIDLDILLYDDIVMSTETLTIPHIDMENRLFVLKPLDEIAGFMRHPILNKTIHQLYTQLEEK